MKMHVKAVHLAGDKVGTASGTKIRIEYNEQEFKKFEGKWTSEEVAVLQQAKSSERLSDKLFMLYILAAKHEGLSAFDKTKILTPNGEEIHGTEIKDNPERNTKLESGIIIDRG